MTCTDIVPAFLAACPRSALSWKEYLDGWAGEAQRSTYTDVAVIVEYLLDRYEAWDVTEFPAAFTALERCLEQGDCETREVITIGIIEEIQGLAMYRAFGAMVFEPWLLPRSRIAWISATAYWSYEFALATLLREQLGMPDPGELRLDLSQVQSATVHRTIQRLYPSTVWQGACRA